MVRVLGRSPCDNRARYFYKVGINGGNVVLWIPLSDYYDIVVSVQLLFEGIGLELAKHRQRLAAAVQPPAPPGV